MASFKKTREMIVTAYAEKLLTDEEFLFLYEANKPVNLELPYYEYEEFNLEENISEAECIVLNYIYDLHHWRITAWNQAILNPLALQQYADAVSDKGAALNNCFGFVDGMVRPICRPGEHQRMVYNGHKRVHALKFQAVALPNGLIGQLFGPVGKS